MGPVPYLELFWAGPVKKNTLYIYPGVVYNVKPATSEMELVIAKDKFLREEIFILAVSKKFTLIRFSLPLYHIDIKLK